MYHLDAHDRNVLGLALDTAMLSIVNAIEDTKITDPALDGYIFMLSEFKRINEKLYTFLTALEDQNALHELRHPKRPDQQPGTYASNSGPGEQTTARKKRADQ